MATRKNATASTRKSAQSKAAAPAKRAKVAKRAPRPRQATVAKVTAKPSVATQATGAPSGGANAAVPPLTGTAVASAPVDIRKGEKREKIVRESFSLPAGELARLKDLRLAVAKAGRIASKSEMLRAGLTLLDARSVAEVTALLDSQPVVRKGKHGKKR